MKLYSLLAKRINKRSLASKFAMLYSFLIVVALGLSATFFYFYYRTALEKRTIEYASAALYQAQYNLENKLKQIEQLSLILVSSTVTQNYLFQSQVESDALSVNAKEVEKLCINVMVSRDDIESISLYTNNGRFVGTNTTNVLEEEYRQIQNAAEPLRGKLCWLYLAGDRPLIVGARIVYSTRTLQPVGLLVIHCRQSVVQSIIMSGVESAGQNFLLDTHNHVIAVHDYDGHDYDGHDYDLTDSEINQIISAAGNGHRKWTVGRRAYVISLRTSSYNDWIYLNILPVSVLAIETSSLLMFLIVTILVLAPLGVFLSGMIAKTMTAPIYRLVKLLKETDVQQLQIASCDGQDEFSFLFAAIHEMIQRIDDLIKSNYEQKLLRSEMELKVLQMQINPHFLYNTLDAMYYMALDCNSPTLARMTKSLSDMMRYSISGSHSLTASLAEEVSHTESYCIIQKLRLGDRLDYYFDIADDVVAQKLPRLCLQPFVENCVLHGYGGNLQQKLSVEIVAIREGDRCIIQISDDGVGLDERVATDLQRKLSSLEDSYSHGIAIPNIHARLQGLFGTDASVTFQAHNAYGGATFTLIVPYDMKN